MRGLKSRKTHVARLGSAFLFRRDREFESGFLQHGVWCEPAEAHRLDSRKPVDQGVGGECEERRRRWRSCRQNLGFIRR